MSKVISRGAYQCAAAILILASGAVFAQDANQQQADETVIDEVVVKGVRTSLANALEQKRAAELVVETISSDSIGQLPDVTIAESIVRLPGINGARDRGNESQAVIRGMGPRLVLGLVNGREVASTEPNRNIRWEVYPSEIVNAVRVYKSQSADLIAGGVAGTIDLRTISPLDYAGPNVVMRGGPVYYEAASDIPDYSEWGYRGSFSLVGEISENLGGALAITAQNQKNGFPSFQGWGYNDDRLPGSWQGDVNGDGEVDATPWGAQTEVKKLDVDRYGVVGALQWRPRDNFELKFDAVYTDFSIDEDQNQAWYSGFGNWGGNDSWKYLDYEFVGSDVVAANINWGSIRNVIAQYTEDKDVFSTGLNAAWTGDLWRFELDGSFSSGERNNVWQAVYTEVYPEFMEWSMRPGETPWVTTSMNPADPENQFAADWLPGAHDGPEKVTDELSALEADYERVLADNDVLKIFTVGARFSNRVKDHRSNSWEQYPPAGGVAIPPEMLSFYEVSAFNVPPLLNGDFNQLAEYVYGGFSDPGGTENLDQRWEVEEDVIEAYAKLDLDLSDRVSGNIGARYVDVDVASSGYEWLIGEDTPPSWNTINHDYTEILPSLNINFHVTDEYILRFGVAKVIARPPLDEMNAVRNRDNPVTTPPPLTAWGGNPQLDPFLAWQFDVSSEWYFADEALFAVALYYKDVETHIGQSTTEIIIDGYTYSLSGPTNGSGGEISGIELTFQTPFSFIRGLENFGIYSNYAYVDSTIEEFHPWWDPLTGAGLAEHTATVDLWYAANRFEARLGYKYHSDYSLIFGWDNWDVRTLEPESTLGLSLKFQVNDQIGLRFQANNLTNETLRNYRDNTETRLGRYDEYGASYLFDVTYGF